MTERQLQRNIRALYINSSLRAFIVTIPIWVSFFSGILTFEQLALLYAIRSAMELLLEMPTGAVADLLGKKISVSLGLVAEGFGYALMAFSKTPIQIYAFMFVIEIGITLKSGALQAWVFDSLKENDKEKSYGKVMSKVNLIFQISMAVAILSGGYLYSVWRGLPWIVEAVAMLLAGGILWIWGTEPKVDSDKFTLSNYFRQTKNGFVEIWKTSYVQALSLFYMLVGGLTWSAQTFFNQIFATQIGFSDIEKSWLFSFIRIFNALILTKYVRSSRWFTRKKGLVLFPVLLLVFFVPAMFANKMIGGVLLFGLTFASSARILILNQFANEEFESKVRATALSSLNMLVGLMYVVITYVSGFFLEDYGAGMVLGVMGVLTVMITTPLAVRLVKGKR